MEESELITIVTAESAILRYMNGLSEQKIPLIISPTETETPRKYRSSILRVEAENSQLVLHQLLPGDWQEHIEPMKDIEITCRMENGTIKFQGLLSPIDAADNGMYCRLPFPKQLSKKQLRACFRVSLARYHSEASIELEDGTEITGTCKNISVAGALVCLPTVNGQIKKGQLFQHCRLLIADALDICCRARVCHLNNVGKNNMLVGLKLLELDVSQRIEIRSAMNTLERLNILK